jgi:uncharacterized protein YlxW (UPF0749 family)
MSDEPTPTVDTGDAPDPERTEPEIEATEEVEQVEEADETEAPARERRLTPSRLVVALLLALLGFTFTVVVRHVADDPAAAALDEQDLVRILANLEAHEDRLHTDIAELEETRERLSTAGQSQQEALAEAERRADELGILAGTLPVRGPGITVTLAGPPAAVSAATLLDAVQELRSAGAEAMQVRGTGGATIRVVASTYFVDSDGGILVDGSLLAGPYTITAIGDPQTLAPALRIPGGVVEKVQGDSGTVTVQEQPGGVAVEAVRQLTDLRYARPDS